MSDLFNQISVNLQTGHIKFPSVEGFQLDLDRVYRVAQMHTRYCKNLEMAVRHAIHDQLISYKGQLNLTRVAGDMNNA